MDGFGKKASSSLSIREVLKAFKEKDVVDLRKERLERLKFTEWRIWKFLQINWR
jgi:hypothetical protein